MPLKQFEDVRNEIFDLSQLRIVAPKVMRNLSVPVLYEEALKYEVGSYISKTGALIVLSHKYTGRLPKEKRIVMNEASENLVHWNDINTPMTERAFEINRERAIDYINSRSRVYVVDAYAGWDSTHRIKIRTICTRAYHALFMTNMLIVPSAKELADFGEPDYTIFNAGVFPANRLTEGVTSDAAIILNLKLKEMVIMGTEYAGEMKKGVFSIMNFLLPQQNVLPMHCAANIDMLEDKKDEKGDFSAHLTATHAQGAKNNSKSMRTSDTTNAKSDELHSPHTTMEDNNTTLFFGLSGTGKTTLSSDPNRLLIGDDEHGWADDKIFNIEGGCYAKCINPPKDIKECISFGTLLENLTFDESSRAVDYSDESITTNTRASYPLSNVKNAVMPSIATPPKNIIFLACDAYGVLPPISKLNREQAMYHYISGYTSKAPNTEFGITEPTATFSACFGEVFLPLNPARYADLLAEKLAHSNANVWLLNTGWIGGNFQTGRRISLRNTRTIIRNICANNIAENTLRKDEYFGFMVCTSCDSINESLDPRDAWGDFALYKKEALKLVAMFHKNIKKYDNSKFINGGPIVKA